MALFPRVPLAFPDPVIDAAYNRVHNDATKSMGESHARALCGEFLKFYFPRSEGWLLSTEKYFPATQSQRGEAHSYFKIDFANEKLQAGGGFVTHMLIEVKPKTGPKDDATAEYNLMSIARAALRKEGTDFIWALQFYGTEIALKKYTRGGDSLVPQPHITEQGDFVDIRAYDARIAQAFQSLKAQIPRSRNAGAAAEITSNQGRHVQDSASSGTTRDAPRNRHAQYPTSTNVTGSGQRNARSTATVPRFQQPTAVASPKCTHDGATGRIVDVGEARIFVKDADWRLAMIGGVRVLYNEATNAYVRPRDQ